jgi:DNA polymerase I
MKNTIMLVDGNALIHRMAYFMPRTLQTKSGFPTWAIKGFFQGLFSEITKLQPTHVSVFFDCQSKKRMEISGGTYKATRGKTLSDPVKELERKQLREQFKPIRQITRSLGFHVCRVKDIEADDLIGTYSKAYPDCRVLILARDKDFNQLISENVSVVDTWGGKLDIRDKQFVIDKYGVTPRQFASYLALVGDKADNIGKVRGLGPKTAKDLLAKHKKLKNVLTTFKAKDRKTIKLAYSLTKIDCGIIEPPKLKKLLRKETLPIYAKYAKKYGLTLKTT